MRIALLLPVWDDPTLPGVARDLAEALPGSPEIVVVARARSRAQPRLSREGRLEIRLVGWVAPPALRPVESAVNAVLVPFALLREIGRISPDLVHYQFAGNDSWLFVGLAAPFLGAPLFVTLQGPVGALSRRPFVRALCGRVLENARAVSAVSEAVRESVLALFPFCAGKITTIVNRVDTAFFAAADGPRPHARRFVFSPSRAAPAKGLDLLLFAFSEVAAAEPEVDLVICGAEDDEGHCRSLCAALGLGSRVRWLGVRPKGEIALLLRHCEAMALGSRGEGLPLAALEALAAGAPIVATAVDGTVECLRDGETALLVPPRDPSALAAGIRRLLEDPALRARLSGAARRAAAAYDRADMGRDYSRWYAGGEARAHAPAA